MVEVPQIMCPNCGMTINLEKRKEIDFYLIKKATKNTPKTFTELLHITRLPRRTLSVRLKELCEKGILQKKDGKYKLNGKHTFENGRKFQRKLPFFLGDDNKKIKISLMLIMLIFSSATFGYALAMFLPEESNSEPKILGTFTMTLYVNEVENLYAWQVIIKYDPQNLKLVNASPGGFLGENYPQYINETNIDGGIFLGPVTVERNTIMVGGTLVGAVEGKSGSGKLAVFTFGYYTANYKVPEIILNEGGFQTKLLNSEREVIPIGENTLIFVVNG